MKATGESFIEIDYCQRAKDGQLISGDVFLSEKVKEEGRIVSVLSDGLGSGVKASVLATMTATMALKFTASPMDIRSSAEIIMDTLPTCSVRKISYSTFTVVDIAATGETRIIEHGNPPFLLIRPDGEASIIKNELRPERWHDRVISCSSFDAQREDRIVFFSDGISQAGMGEFKTPFGWGVPDVEKYVRNEIREHPHISARELSRQLVARAEQIDGLSAKDDITCGIVYFRSPRQLLVLTGAPFNRAHDNDLARMAEKAPGRKVICGGTTANIISRQLNRPIHIDMRQARDSRVPPSAKMDGFDLVTEGILTLGEVLRLLEEDIAPEELRSNAAVRLTAMLLDSDEIKFGVGTRINEAHQDPNVPVDLELRRNIVRRIAQGLETKHMKRVSIQYL
ncbi:SpoIIE family protein phosphatase [Occallatibacter savannae]|uniref:SpoIIE family protein phosphatase n=1 Tax=Occallatibacter savannae TaxID=1002691 RepID=UPI000D68B1EE|nr:SpoIIE family protein phosphatase [Occallatibacter savannae]